MPAPLTLAIFQVDNPQGRSLAKSAKAAAQAMGFKARICSDGNQEDLMRACLFDDYILFDASVERGHNYPMALEALKSLPHALIVSRTYLPVNFVGAQSGGAPGYPKSFSNDQILRWLERQLERAKERPPRPKPKSMSISSAMAMYEEAPGLPSADVFISYRGQLVEKVKGLARRVESGKFKDVPSRKVKIFQPAPRTFHQTAMTAFDRWAVLAVISDAIIGSKEVWIYDSQGKSEYLQSWWTIGELVVCAYRELPLKRIDAETEKLGKPRPKHRISLTEAHKDRLSLLFTNSHPL